MAGPTDSCSEEHDEPVQLYMYGPYMEQPIQHGCMCVGEISIAH